jgi:glycosyltransferase involved in cell wall biosynthesis
MNNKKPSLLFVTNEYPEQNGTTRGGGVATTYYELTQGLSKEGFDVTVITHASDKEVSYKDGNVFVYRIPLPESGKNTLKVKTRSKVVFKAICKLVKTKNFDIIQFPELNGEGYYFFKARKKAEYKETLGKMTAIVRLHSSTKPYKKLNKMLTDKEAEIMKMEKYTIQQCDLVISPCRATADAVKKAMNIKNFPLIYINNAIDIDLFKPRTNPKESKQILIGYVGKLRKAKGTDTLLEAFSNLARKYDHITLHLIGKQDYIKEYKANYGEFLIKDFPKIIKDKITFTDLIPRKELVKYYQEFDLFVFPTRHDNLPNSVVEAMACGIPVISTKIGGIPELIGDNSPNILVNSENVQELEEAMEKMIITDTLRQEAGLYNRRRIVENCSREKIITSYINLYNSLEEA